MIENIQYRYSCVTAKDLNELNFIIDNSREISNKTFLKNIGIENYKSLETDLAYGVFPSLRLNNDYHVRFHKSKKEDGTPVYYCCHSAIEYIYY